MLEGGAGGASEKATSVGSSSGLALRWAARRSAASRRAGSVLAERAGGASRQGLGSPLPLLVARRLPRTGRRLLQDHVGVGAADPEGGDAGAAGAPVLLARASPRSAARPLPAAQSTCEEGASTCRVFGSSPSRIAITILITPATPAAAWVWPMLDLIEPSCSGSLSCLVRRWRAGPRPRSGRRAWCRCRGPRPRRLLGARGGRWRGPGGSPAPGRGRWGRSGRWRRRPG